MIQDQVHESAPGIKVNINKQPYRPFKDYSKYCFWIGLRQRLMIGSELVEHLDRFTYLASLISTDGLLSDLISARI